MICEWSWNSQETWPGAGSDWPGRQASFLTGEASFSWNLISYLIIVIILILFFPNEKVHLWLKQGFAYFPSFA